MRFCGGRQRVIALLRAPCISDERAGQLAAPGSEQAESEL